MARRDSPSLTRRDALALASAVGLPSLASATRTPSPMRIPARSRYVGVNLAGIAYFASQFPFADMTKNSGGWEFKVDAGGDPTPWRAAREGHPLALGDKQRAEMAFGWENAGFPVARYTVLWDGDGSVSFPLGRLAVRSQAKNRAVVEVLDANSQLRVSIDRSNPADPVRNVRYLWPGTESSYHAQPFNPEFLQRIAPFSVLRFMDWDTTNGSNRVEWAQRTLPSDAGHAERGVPYELMIELANLLRADAWFCVPHKASDDYVRRMAVLIRDRLDPARKAYIEYSNEVWNWGFQQTHWSAAEADRLRLGRPHGFPSRFYAQRSVEIFRLFEQVFRPQARERLVRVIAGQAVWTQFSEDALSHKDTASQCDALAIAPYFHAGWTDDPKRVDEALRLTSGELHELMRRHIRGDVKRAIEQNVALAKKHKLKLLAYEAGVHDRPASAPEGKHEAMTALFSKAHRDPGMKSVYDEYWALWIASGGDVMLQFNDIGRWSKWGLWGALERVTDDPAASPKYRSLVETIARHP